MSTGDGFSSPYLLLSGYDAANRSPRRGYLYWPTLNTKFEANQLSRYEIRRRVHWLYGNFGAARRLVNGYARLIGYLTPVPDSADEDWNDLAFVRFMECAGSPAWFDRSAKFDFIEGQLQMERTAAKDGYLLPVLTSSESNGAQLAFYESHQIMSPRGAAEDWVDGVKLDKFHRHIAYGVRNAESETDVRIIAASDALYYGRHESWGEVHPLSILAAAVNNLIDVVEIRSDIKHAIKSTAMIGLVYEREALAPISVPGGGLAGPLVTTTERKPDGTTQDVTWEMVLSGGQIPTLPPGVKAKVIQDSRPHINNREFEKDLIKDCAANIDLPYEALFEMSGITGPGVRYWMADIRRWVLTKHLYRARWCQRYYATFIAKEIASGRLPEPRNDPRFWRCTWIGMADPTIDRASGNDTIIQLDAGLTTWADEWGAKGAFWKKKVRQRVREYAYAQLECLATSEETGLNIRYEDVFRRQNQQVMPASDPTNDEEGSAPKPRRGDTDDEDNPDPPPPNKR